MRSRGRGLATLVGLVLVVGLGVGGLAACGASDSDARPAAAGTPEPTPVPRLIWSRQPNIWGPGETSGRWWAVSIDSQSGPGPMHPANAVGLQTGNALTGKVHKVETPRGRLVCSLGALAPDPGTGAGRFLVGTMHGTDCEIALLDVGIDGHRWQREVPSELVPDPPSEVQEGETIVGTWDGTTVIRSWNGVTESVLARDSSGTTVWSVPQLDHRESPIFLFDWTETVVPTSAGPLLVTYDFDGPGPVPDLGEQPDATLTLLDPATGTPTRELGTVEDSNFLWLVDDIAIFAKGGEYAATYDGYRLPEVD